MKNVLVLLLFFSCSSAVEDTFNSVELISSKGERIYLNSLNWGVTDDNQVTVISSNSERVRVRTDTIDVVKGLEPFFYSFSNDTLNLYFNNTVTYKVKEKFKTITINYTALSAKEYRLIRQKAYENNGYYSIPKREKTDYPLDIPGGPNRLRN